MGQKTKPTFYPPKESLGWYHGAWTFMRLFVHAAGTAGFELPPEDADRLRALSRDAVLLCPNHPTSAEGPLMYLVGHRLNLRYTHCAALEIYDKLGPLGPGLFPGIGCFSIRRRVVDYPAYNAARALLAARRNLVLFPEGEISGMSDRVLPLERGGVQIAFWALDKMRAESPSGRPEAPLYIVPIAIKYRETGDPPRAVLESLARLERALCLPTEAGRGALARLARIESAYLESLERKLGIPEGDAFGVNARWDRVRQIWARRAACALGVAPPRSDLTRPQCAREMLNAWEAAWAACGPKGPRRGSDEWLRLKTIHKDVACLNRFMGFEEDYVASWPSVERFSDVLRRLEDQILGRHRFKARRIARLRVGEPIDITPLYGDYCRDKKGAVGAVTAELGERIDTLLGQLIQELSRPWEGACDTDHPHAPSLGHDTAAGPQRRAV